MAVLKWSTGIAIKFLPKFIRKTLKILFLEISIQFKKICEIFLNINKKKICFIILKTFHSKFMPFDPNCPNRCKRT
jgi:hypothetical protein